MNHSILQLTKELSGITAIMGMIAQPFVSVAQDTDETPIITIKSHRYETAQGTIEASQIQFSLMSKEPTEIKVDMGYGTVKKYTVTGVGDITIDDYYDTLTGGTTISGPLGPSGVIRVWGDASQFDYFDIHGSEVFDLDIAQLTNLEILSLSHNAIRKLDLSEMADLMYVDVADNTFEEGFTLGDNHPMLLYLNVNQLGDKALTSGTIDIAKYPLLQQFSAWDTKCLRNLDPTQNPELRRISIDNSGVKHLDVSQNAKLEILNVSDCGFSELDVTHNAMLRELYIANESSQSDAQRIKTLDLSQNPQLYRLFFQGNALTSLDLSHNLEMQSIYGSWNKLNDLDVSMLMKMDYLDVIGNCFDFVTLPEPNPNLPNLLYYVYDMQRDWEVDAEYAVGQTLDLSARTERHDSESHCFLLMQNDDLISDPVVLTEGVDFTYFEGKLTFLKEQEDPVFAMIVNSVMTDCEMLTTKFRVRKVEDYGKPVTLFTVTPEIPTGEKLTGSYRINHGELKTINQLYIGLPIEIKGMLGENVTELTITSPLESIDLTKLYNLEKLDLSGCGLTDIDLSWNRSLVELNLNDNRLSRLNLNGVNVAYNKNTLTKVYANSNSMKEFVSDMGTTYHLLSLQNNELEDIYLDDMDDLKTLLLDQNRLKEIDLRNCASLQELSIDNNLLTRLDLKSCPEIKNISAIKNRMKFSTLPAKANGVTMNLAPQQEINIAVLTQMVDLSSESTINGRTTHYTWYDASTGNMLIENEDYTLSNGKTTFMANAEGKEVYCVLANDSYSEFAGKDALRTTLTKVSTQPMHEIASFTTPVGDQEVGISLAAANPDTYIYIDWGDGNLVEYALQTTYQLYNATTIRNAHVRVLSIDKSDGDVTVFSFNGATMTDLDVSHLSQLYCLTIDNANLNEIDLTHNPKLAELSLGGNQLSSIDLSQNPNVKLLYLANNNFETLDVSGCSALEWLQAPSNQLTSVNVNGLNRLYNIDVTHNLLESIDVSQCPELFQLFVAENHLHEIDLSNNHKLYAVNLNDNYFDFSTLPIPQWNVYYYANQAPLHVECIDGRVDLSSQMMADGISSQIYWFVGELELIQDEDNNLELLNEELIQGEDYFVQNGICTFKQSWPLLTGYIYNPVFPDILFFTEPISVTATSGIEQINSDAAAEQTYNAVGMRIDRRSKGFVLSRKGIEFRK